MSGARPDGTEPAGRKGGAGRAFGDGRNGAHRSEHSSGRSAPVSPPDGGHEILRTERREGEGRSPANGPAPIHGPGAPAGTGGKKRPSGPRHRLASGWADETYGGWLPSDVLLAPGEALAAVLVAEIGLGLALLVQALAGRLAELPEPLAEHGFAAAFFFGLVCGLYVLFRLRSRRLAWRRHLRGEP